MSTTSQLTLVTGGIRSGKSELAERLASDLGERVVYVATGGPTDSEMRARIEEHRRRRPSSWITVEVEARSIAEALQPHVPYAQAVLLDDLGGVVTRAVTCATTTDEADSWLQREEQLLWSLLERVDVPAIAVTSEVGLSLVPANELGRRFIDVLGRANQRWAARAETVILVVAGIPWKLK
ncbi:MAG TPA: bifunctional adenosylcobinamide kinase/adenosylcobinamide-phosphate guanylyltransferase [Chloroflexota bacterium]|nr:bifunctional adenosylcobinamide kinase/adenosylcobinamide-phosphate guanylyltransferase [Chloroflexota bacterium]